MESTGWWIGVSPDVVRDDRGEITGIGYLRLPPPEHSWIVHFDQAHCGPVSGGGAEAGVEGGQAVVGAGLIVLGGGADGGLGGGTDRGGTR